jgi:group I intron endonuclease
MSSRYGSVYIITNQITGEQYVGQTIKSCASRFRAHKQSAKKPKFRISYVMAEYGVEAFSFMEVYVAFDKLALDNAEKRLIAELSPEYNMTRGGAGSPGRPMKESTRVKIVENLRARWADPEWREMMREKLREASNTAEAVERGRKLSLHEGGKIRWAGHVKKPKANLTTEQRAELTRKSWENPKTRELRLANHKIANLKPEVRLKRSIASTGRRNSDEAIQRIAKAKWRPVYCKELQVTFLSGKFAAEYFGVGHTAISNAIKSKGRVGGKYTLQKVA